MSRAARRSGVRRLGGLLALVVASTLLATGCGSGSTAAGRRDRPVYVALGDSYTSGLGIAPVADPRCGRSALDYASRLARQLKAAAFVDRSCAGASTADLDEAQTHRATRLNDPQLDAVDEHTTLVTVGLGLNDEAVSTGLLLVCLDPHGGPLSPACERYLATPQRIVEAQLSRSAARVEAALTEIRHRAPRARIVLVGYPRLVPDTGSCPERLPVPEAQVERMRVGMRDVDTAWRRAAEQSGATYVDMYAVSEGHDICSDDPWIAGARGVLGTAAALHPSADYHAAVAAEIERALDDRPASSG